MVEHSSDMKAFIAGGAGTPLPVSKLSVSSITKPDKWLGAYEKTIEGTKLLVLRGRMTQSDAIYTVKLIEGDWPKPADLYYALDGGTTYGGEIMYLDADKKIAQVTIWID